MKAAIYARQSKDRLGNELAVSRQLEDCRAICDSRGWGYVEYIENNTSASTGRRPVYTDMLADIEGGTIGAVVAWDADRLTRQPRELEDFIDLADRHGLALATAGGDFDLSTPTGRGNARMRGVFARMEMEQKSARQKRAAKQHAANGGGWGGRRPFGYEQGTNVIRPAEAKLIRKAYKAVLAGDSLYSIASQWNEAGVTTTVGNPWSGSTVRQVLVNPRYCGKRAYKGDVVADAAWKAIVTEDLWTSAVAVLTDTARRRSRAPGRKYLMTGILRCGQCKDGTTMGSGVANADGALIYVCKHCHRLSRRLAPVDALVVKLTVGYLSRPDVLTVLTATDHRDISELREQERALLDSIDGLAVDRAKGYLTGRQVKVATDALDAELADVRSQMVDSTKARVFDGLAQAQARGAVASWFGGLSLDRQRAIIDTIMVVTLIPSGRGRPFTRDHLDLKWVTGDD